MAIDHRAEPNAPALLNNFFLVGIKTESGESRSFLPPPLVINLLSDAGLWESLPTIRHYSRRPIFSADFNLCQPGWNASSGIMVHADAIDPVLFTPPAKSGLGPISHLPPRLAALLGEFSWRSDADLVNAVAFLLTGLLVNHFADDPHPGVIVDGNQPGLGKTLLVQVVGQLMDNAEPPRIPLSREEELQKQLGALIRRSTCSVAFFDNVRGRLDSQTLEQSILSPKLSFRLLGQSATIERSNDLLWAITSNSATGTSDLINRCIPIRLYYEGDPRGRKFTGNPLRFVKDHRDEILGELAGMVLRWEQVGKPLGLQRHRCDRWAGIIGGILNSCGLGDRFLENLAEAESEMDQGLEDLAALAEHALRGNVQGAIVRGALGRDKAVLHPAIGSRSSARRG